MRQIKCIRKSDLFVAARLHPRSDLNVMDSRLASLIEPAYLASFDVSPNSLQMGGLNFDEEEVRALHGLQTQGFIKIFQGKEYIGEGYKITEEGKEWYERAFCLKPR